MREIKFKFYSKNDEGKFSVSESSLDEIEDNDSWQGATPWKRIAVCQYTGLKDKNGKEIYEGDIVTYGSRGNKPVGFLIGEFVLLNENGEFYDSVGSSSKELEVIGNTYENPELLMSSTPSPIS